MKSHPTVKDVAKMAGVSLGTVSKVLNNDPTVRPQNRLKVFKAISKLGFKPNPFARSLPSNKTHIISIFTPVIAEEFYGRLLGSVDETLTTAGYNVSVYPLFSQEKLNSYANSAAFPYRADGIFMFSLIPEKLFFNGFVPTEKTVVLVDAFSQRYDSVYIDNRHGGYLIGKHLSEKPGQFYIISVSEESNSRFSSGVFEERVKGFKEALVESGIPLDNVKTFTVKRHFSEIFSIARRILRCATSSMNIFAVCDVLAIWFLEVARDQGLKIGKDIKVAGFDDSKWSQEIGLTTVCQPIEEMGRKAAEIMLKRLRGDGSPVYDICFKPKLMLRNSTGMN